MVRAAATGRLDYTTADSDDARWCLREKYILQEVERETLITYTVQRQMQQVATASGPSAMDKDAKLFTEHYRRGNIHLMMLGQLLFPWEKWEETDQYKEDFKQLRAEYIAKFGDPSTPDARARAAKDEEALKRSRLLTAQQAALADKQKQEQKRKIQGLRDSRYRFRERT